MGVGVDRKIPADLRVLLKFSFKTIKSLTFEELSSANVPAVSDLMAMLASASFKVGAAFAVWKRGWDLRSHQEEFSTVWNQTVYIQAPAVSNLAALNEVSSILEAEGKKNKQS